MYDWTINGEEWDCPILNQEWDTPKIEWDDTFIERHLIPEYEEPSSRDG